MADHQTQHLTNLQTDEHRRQLAYLIRGLHSDILLPDSTEQRWLLLRALMNIRVPGPVDPEWVSVQDQVLQRETNTKGITEIGELEPTHAGMYLWKGDITTLRVDAIVNAANSALLGCFHPLHRCIDNAIHTYAGIQLREECATLMRRQGHPEPTGQAKITMGYNLPAKHVIHTVGPIIGGTVTERDCEQLASCYQSCLQLANQQNLKTMAFCCISTGEFRFPKEQAAKIAVRTVAEYRRHRPAAPAVIFNVFTDDDLRTYEATLG
ncbi:MAG: protein-ADP-ribose hydrolase [Actinomyces sp.]|jgi:O-acetyl-ADP-ribose deacetylase (regulator of RNase III)|nr:protein-ADP-ribose hydrolase [Actinomyces sp.]MCI1788031.1 protein-ADP-ribose hydrolase [Actinomyces sp.]MCI1830580.1 protein-ADP-ribose hydrolase [Actinomyces sp.]